MALRDILGGVARLGVAAALTYLGFLALLTLPFFQTHIIYLHRVTLTWFQDVNIPEQWGFLPNQVTPFHLKTPDGETLHAWHILPLGLYERQRVALTAEPAGLAPSIQATRGFELLRADPESLLVLYFHGAAGTLGSGYRPPSYRAISALEPNRIHIVAIDYRGFGTSTGYPSEDGLLTDALTLTRWALEEARIPPERIVVFAQSVGTAVAISLAEHLAGRDKDPVLFRGMVLVAPFASADQLASTYSVAGVIPLLAPLARFQPIYDQFKRLLICKWPSKLKLANLVHRLEAEGTRRGAYDITVIHAKDDWDIPWTHSEALFWHAVGAATTDGVDPVEVRGRLESEKRPIGSDGWSLEHRTPRGVLRQEIVEYGLHDRIMSYPIVSTAVWRAFHSALE